MSEEKIKIVDEQFMSNLRVGLEDTLFFDDWQTAYRFVRKFEPPLAAKSQQIPEQFRDELRSFIIQAKWIALPSLEDKEIVDLFQNYFMVQFGLPGSYYDIWDKLRAKLITIPIFDDRDELRKQVKNALLLNKERITSNGPLDQTGKGITSTIGNWLIDYNKGMGGQAVNATKLNEYIIRHPVAGKLPDKEKGRLKKLFNFYEIVKISSLDPQGYEETISIVDEKWGPGIIQAGRFFPTDSRKVGEMADFIKKLEEVGAIGEKLDENVKKIKAGKNILEKEVAASDIEKVAGVSGEIRLNQIFQQFFNTVLIQKCLEQQDALQRETNKDLKQLRNQFYHSVNEGKAEEAVGALLAMAEAGKLGEAFGQDDRFIKFWGGWLEKALTPGPSPTPLSRERGAIDLGEFKNDPADVKYIAMFLEYILVNRLKMKPEEAAMTGVLVANLARQAGETEYQTISYGDEETGEFRWNIE